MKLQIDTDNLYKLQIIRNPDNTFGIHYISITKERTWVKNLAKYGSLEQDTIDIENVNIDCVEIKYKKESNIVTKNNQVQLATWEKYE